MAGDEAKRWETTPTGTTHDATSDTQGRTPGCKGKSCNKFWGLPFIKFAWRGQENAFMRRVLGESNIFADAAVNGIPPHRNINGRQQIRLFLCSCSGAQFDCDTETQLQTQL